MNLNGNFQVLGADRYSVDGSSGGKVYLMGDKPSSDPDKVGREVMSAKADFDFIDQLREFATQFPCLCSVDYEMVSGAKKSITMKVTKVTPVKKP